MASKKISYTAAKTDLTTGLSAAFAMSSSLHTNNRWETVRLEDIIEDPKGDFTNLFAYDPNAAQLIAESIERGGFDQTQVIHLAKIREEPETMQKGIRIDGRHRFEAAKIAGLTEIPVFIHIFDTREEALIYALELQVLRRNLAAHEKMEAVERLDQLRNPGRKIGQGEGRSAAALAAKIGEKQRTVERMRNIIQNGDDATKAAVKAGQISISKADKIINEKKASKKNTDIKEIPDEIEPEVSEHVNVIKDPLKEKYHEGFIVALRFALGEVLQGKTPAEIWNDERLGNSRTIEAITSFQLPEVDKEITDKL